MKLSEKLEALRHRAGAMMREHKERAAERKAAKAARSHNDHHGRFFLLTVPAAATILAAVTEWYWAILFCIEATGAIDWNYETAIGSTAAPSSLWNFAFSTHWPVFLGLICATVPIVMLSMVWLPVQFAMRGAGRIRRGSIIAVGVLANVLVIVSGTVVMNYNRQDQVRDALVVEQTAAAGRGAIQAQIEAVNGDLARLTDRRVNNEYAATAANVGAAGYRAQYMSAEALARSPEARRDIIVRALGAAERADALRAERTALFQQLAQAPTEAAVAANVADTVGAGLNAFAQQVEVWRPPFIALICTLIGIFGTWWVIAMLERMNPRDVLHSGWADEAHRIEDLREMDIVDSAGRTKKAEPMMPPREDIYDAETGERLVKVKGAREHYRKAGGKKGKPVAVPIQPDIPPDERGADTDGGARIATTLPGVPAMNDLGGSTQTKQPESADERAHVDRVQEHEVREVAEAPGFVDAVSEESPIHEPSEPPELPELSDEETMLAMAVVAGQEAFEQEHTEPVGRTDGGDEDQRLEPDRSEGFDQNDDSKAPADADASDESGSDVIDHDTTPTPETRPERLLPASVAAE